MIMNKWNIGGMNMSQSILQMEKDFFDYNKKISAYNEALALIYWDLRTGAPKQGINQRAEVIGVLSSEVYDLSVSETMAAYLATLSSKEAQPVISDITKKLVEECTKEYDHKRKIPSGEYKEYVILLSQAESIWEEAREKADFELYRPYLEKIVAMNKRFIEYWGYKGNKYNTLLDLYEPGMTVRVLDQVFSDLRANIVPLVRKIANSTQKPVTDYLYKTISKRKTTSFYERNIKSNGI